MEALAMSRVAIVFVIVLLSALLVVTRTKAGPISTSSTVADLIRSDLGAYTRRASDLFGIPQERVQAIIAVETKGKNGIPGAAGEVGLMQIMPIAFADVTDWLSRNGGWKRFGLPEIGYSELWDAEKNIIVGTLYLRILRDRAGDLNVATQAYNAGLSKVQRDPTAGSAYLSKVLAWENSQFNF